MSSRNFHPTFATCVFLAAASCAWAQSAPDLVSPKLREKVVADAARVAESRNSPVTLPSPLPNPFVAKESEPEITPEIPTEVPVREAPMDNLQLLERLARQIPATGTVTLGGEPILLLGQKRLKVGDSYTISFEGQTYEVSIAAITATSFTVKRGALLFSRPTRLSGSPTSTPSSRP